MQTEFYKDLQIVITLLDASILTNIAITNSIWGGDKENRRYVTDS